MGKNADKRILRHRTNEGILTYRFTVDGGGLYGSVKAEALMVPGEFPMVVLNWPFEDQPSRPWTNLEHFESINEAIAALVGAKCQDYAFIISDMKCLT